VKLISDFFAPSSMVMQRDGGTVVDDSRRQIKPDHPRLELSSISVISQDLFKSCRAWSRLWERVIDQSWIQITEL